MRIFPITICVSVVKRPDFQRLRRRFHKKAFGSALFAYICQVAILCGGIWGVLEVNAGTNPKLMPELFGVHWRGYFYGLAFILAIPTAFIVYRRKALPKFLRELRIRTNQTADRIPNAITGTGTTFRRNELAIVSTQLSAEPVLLIGEGGTGKSAIGVELVRRANIVGSEGLLIDARDVQHRDDEAALRQYYSCDSDLAESIGDIGSVYGVRLVIDQLDSVITQPIAGVLIDLAMRCSRYPGVEIVVISRRKEEWEHRILAPLVGAGFAPIACREISLEDVGHEFERLGVNDASPALREACRNLLNLDLLAQTLGGNPDLNVAELDETGLWEAFFENLRQVEQANRGLLYSSAVWNEAIDFARMVIRSGDQYIQIADPSEYLRRLISWNILEQVGGDRYKFRHERMPDYIYARSAAARDWRAEDLINDVGYEASRNAILWLTSIYGNENPLAEVSLLEELLIDG